MPPLSSFSNVRISCIKLTHALEGLKLRANGRDRGGGGAGRAIAVPLLLRDLFSRAPVDMEKIPGELLDFALWKSEMFACPNDYNLICLQG